MRRSAAKFQKRSFRRLDNNVCLHYFEADYQTKYTSVRIELKRLFKEHLKIYQTTRSTLKFVNKQQSYDVIMQALFRQLSKQEMGGNV